MDLHIPSAMSLKLVNPKSPPHTHRPIHYIFNITTKTWLAFSLCMLRTASVASSLVGPLWLVGTKMDHSAAVGDAFVLQYGGYQEGRSVVLLLGVGGSSSVSLLL